MNINEYTHAKRVKCEKLIKTNEKLPKAMEVLRVLSSYNSKKIIRLLDQYGPLTTKEVSKMGNYTYYSDACRSIAELRNAGFVEYDGDYKQVGGKNSMTSTPHKLNITYINRIGNIVKDFNQL